MSELRLPHFEEPDCPGVYEILRRIAAEGETFDFVDLIILHRTLPNDPDRLFEALDG